MERGKEENYEERQEGDQREEKNDEKSCETATLRGENLTNKKHYVTSEVIHRYKISGGDINYSSNDTLVNQAVAGLMNSHGHKVIMTSQNIKYIGVGVLKEKRRFIVVMVFADEFPYTNNYIFSNVI